MHEAISAIVDFERHPIYKLRGLRILAPVVGSNSTCRRPGQLWMLLFLPLLLVLCRANFSPVHDESRAA